MHQAERRDLQSEALIEFSARAKPYYLHNNHEQTNPNPYYLIALRAVNIAQGVGLPAHRKNGDSFVMGQLGKDELPRFA